MTALHGKDFILAFRLLSEAETKSGIKLAYQIEHTISKSRSTDVTQTKDGPLVSSGGIERTIEITAISTKDELNLMLEKSVDDGETLEIWEIDLSSKDNDEYDALYMRGKLTDWETPRNVEDYVEITTEAVIEGTPKPGKVTLTAEQEQEIAYAFRNLEPVTTTP